MQHIYQEIIVLKEMELMGCFSFGNLFQIYPFEKLHPITSSRTPDYLVVLEYAYEGNEIMPNYNRKRNMYMENLLSLLSSLLNGVFFQYKLGAACWGVPSKIWHSTSRRQNLTSQWIEPFIMVDGSPSYSELSGFTMLGGTNTMIPCDASGYYSTRGEKHLVFYPCNLDVVLNTFFSQTADRQEQIFQCMRLATDGLEILDDKRALGEMAIFSAIEGLANLDLDLCSRYHKRTPRFIEFMKKYVNKDNEEEYKNLYAHRGDITHEGCLSISEYSMNWKMTPAEIEDEGRAFKIRQYYRIAVNNFLCANGHTNEHP